MPVTDLITGFPTEQSIACKQAHIGPLANQAMKWQNENLFTKLPSRWIRLLFAARMYDPKVSQLAG